jgi:hypothetical protein
VPATDGALQNQPVQSGKNARAQETYANHAKSVLDPSNWELTFCARDEEFVIAAMRLVC